jgi:hypothetical protein
MSDQCEKVQTCKALCVYKWWCLILMPVIVSHLVQWNMFVALVLLASTEVWTIADLEHSSMSISSKSHPDDTQLAQNSKLLYFDSKMTNFHSKMTNFQKHRKGQYFIQTSTFSYDTTGFEAECVEHMDLKELSVWDRIKELVKHCAIYAPEHKTATSGY